MQVNFDCNCPKPQFGRFLKVKQVDVPSFIAYTKVEGFSNSMRREKALRKLLTSQNSNKNFDLRYDADNDSIFLLRSSDGKQLREFKSTKKTKLEAMGNGFFARIKAIFDGTLLLPENLLEAVRRANSLDKQARSAKI